MARKSASDILLVSPPPWDVDNPPVNVALLSSYLRKQGYDTACLDLNIWLYNKIDENFRYLWLFESSPYWKNEHSYQEIRAAIAPVWDELVDQVCRVKTDLVGISLADSREMFTVDLVQAVKQRRPDLKIVLGGPACSSPGQLAPFTRQCAGLIECYVFGEGEVTLEETMRALRDGTPLSEVRGIWLPVEGGRRLEATSARPRAPIGELPFPTYQEFDLTQYRQNTLVMVWSRGCPARCTFCDVPGIWGKFRFRAAENIFDEIRYHVEKNRIRDYMIFDSVVNGNIRELERLCDMVIDAGLPISWQALVTPRKQMTRQLYFKMAKSGCHRLEFGLESGSDPVLAGMVKMFNSGIAAKNLRDAHDAGIKTVCFVMVGFPGETEQNFQETIQFLEEHKSSIDEISTINTAVILDQAELSVLADKVYDIERPAHRGDYHWSMPGNDYEVRRDRAQRMVEAVERIGIKLVKTNLLEGENHCTINTGKTGSMVLEPPVLERKAEYFRKKHADPAAPHLLLVMPPPWGTSTPPLGVSYLATHARSVGYRVKVLDFNIDCYRAVPTAKRLLWDPSYAPHWNHAAAFGETLALLEPAIDALVHEIVALAPGMLGFSVHCDNRLLVLELIRRIKPRLPFTLIAAGGMEMLSSTGRNLMQPRGAVDAFVVGEGERPLVELMDRMRDGRELNGIKGVQLFRDGGYAPLEPAPLWAKLDEIAWPDFRDYDLAKYDTPMLPLLFCRGCIAQCAFCDDRVIMGTFRIRTSEHMVREIEEHVAQGVEQFIFNDLLINSNVRRLEDLCDLIIERGLGGRIRWMGNAIVRNQMTAELLVKMRRAGCWALMYGIESGSATVLKAMKKMFSPEMADVVLAATRDAGIEAWCNFIVGFPGEGEAELQETVDFINRNKASIARVAVINKCNVLPETELARHPEKYGIQYPDNAETDHYCWFTTDGNTNEARTLRAEKILELLGRLEIPIGQTNFLAQGEADAVRSTSDYAPGSFLRSRQADELVQGAPRTPETTMSDTPRDPVRPSDAPMPPVPMAFGMASAASSGCCGGGGGASGGCCSDPADAHEHDACGHDHGHAHAHPIHGANGNGTNGKVAKAPPRIPIIAAPQGLVLDPHPSHHVAPAKSERHIALCAVPPWGVEDPPVGIGYIATYLRKRGWDISIFDLNAEWHHRAADEYKALWHVENKNLWNQNPSYDETLRIFGHELDLAADRIVASGAPYVGLSVVDPRERLSAELARRVRERDPSVRVVFGGAQCFTAEGRALFYGDHGRCIDALIGGEGEHSVLELLESWEQGKFTPIQGVQLMQDGRPYGPFVERRFDSDVDAMGFPTYTEGFPLDKYVKKRLVMTWSRSCAGNCSFCKEKAIWGSFRSRTPGHVIEEIKHHIDVHGISNYAIFDSAVNSHPGIIRAICERIVAEKLDIRWQAMAIPRKAMEPDLLELMHAAGCRKLIYGVESGSDVVLAQMRKMFKAEDAQAVIRETHKAGIKATINILTGFPAEGEKEFQETLDFLSRNAGYIDMIDSISDLQLVPGTIVSCYAETFGIDVPKDGGHYQWTSGDHNTHAKRKDRIRRIVELAHELKIPMLQSNTFDEGKQFLLSKKSDEIKLDNFRSHVNNLNTFKAKGKVRREVRFDKISKSLLVVSPYFNVRTQPANLDGVMSALYCHDHNPLASHLNTRYYMKATAEADKAFWVEAETRVNDPAFADAYAARTSAILDDVTAQLTRHDMPRLVLHTAPTTTDFVEALLARVIDHTDSPDYVLDLTGRVTPRLLELAAQAPPTEIVYDWGMIPLHGARLVVLDPADPAGCARAVAGAALGLARKRDGLYLAGMHRASAREVAAVVDALAGTTVRWAATFDPAALVATDPDALARAGCVAVVPPLMEVEDGFLERIGAGYDAAALGAAFDALIARGIAVEPTIEIGHPHAGDAAYAATLVFFRAFAGRIAKVRALSTYMIRPGSELDGTEERTGLYYPRIQRLHTWHDRFANNFMYRGKRLRELIIFLLGHDYDFPSRYIPGAGPFLRHRDRIFSRLERQCGGTRTTVARHPRAVPMAEVAG